MNVILFETNKNEAIGIAHVLGDSFQKIQIISEPELLYHELKSNPIQYLFWDIDPSPERDLGLIEEVAVRYTGLNIILISSSILHAYEAYQIPVLGYLLKPFGTDEIHTQLEKWAHAKFMRQKQRKVLNVKCFGNFEVFDQHHKPLKFKYKKSKELLAYLIQENGSTCNTHELAAVLYYDREDTPSLMSLVRNLITDVKRTLTRVGAEDAIYRNHSDMAIVPDLVDCDYYSYRNDEMSLADLGYCGFFMNQYEWADPTASWLASQC